MDLSIKKHNNDNVSGLNITDKASSLVTASHQSNPASVFLPYDFPLDCRVVTPRSNSDEFCREVSRLEKRSEETKQLLERVMPIMAYYRNKYPKIDTPQSFLEMPMTMGTPPNNLSEKSRKRKRSIDYDSSTCTSEESSTQGRQTIDHNEGPSQFPKLINPNTVQIGSRGTLISKEQFDNVFWLSASAAVRCLLGFLFDAETLATHTLTGKPSPAFVGRERPPKNRLDENKVADITECVQAIFKGASVREIRATITTKCADASKKKRQSATKFISQSGIISQSTPLSENY